jgi:hypothetical protein
MNVGSPMTQAMPSAWAQSQVSEDRAQLGGRSVDNGHTAATDGDRHIGVREHGSDHRLGFRHDFLRGPVVDAQRGQVDVAEPDPLEPFLPGLREPVPGLGAVADDREAPRRAAPQQHLPLRVGQLLSLVPLLDAAGQRLGEMLLRLPR